MTTVDDMEAAYNADKMSPGQAACLVAVIQGARTWPEVIQATGLARATVHYHLHRLRDEGLVGFEDGIKGSLHPTVEIVAVSPWRQ